MIVRNATISYFAYAYRLDDGVRRASSDTPCSQGLAADLFEAHVGALAEYEELHPLEPPHLSQWLAQLVSDATLPDLAKEASERIAQLRAPRVTKGTSSASRALRLVLAGDGPELTPNRVRSERALPVVMYALQHGQLDGRERTHDYVRPVRPGGGLAWARMA